MNDISSLQSMINLHDLAAHLGMQRHQSGSYHAPWREDSTPSLSVYDDGRRWKDHGSDKGGDAIQLVRDVKGFDFKEAKSYILSWLGVPAEGPAGRAPRSAPPRQTSQPARRGGSTRPAIPQAQASATPAPASPSPRENAGPDSAYLWQKARSHALLAQATAYLVEQRKLPADQVAKWAGRAFGFTDWKPQGEGEGFGAGVVFPVIVPGEAAPVAINIRYLAQDHEPKSRTIGPVSGGLFCPDPAILKAPAVWLVEGAIDALTLTAAGCPAVAFLSAVSAASFPLAWLQPHQRVMILADADEAGRKAGNTLYHRCITEGVTVQLVEWPKEHKDCNDALKAGITMEGIKAMAETVDFSLFPAGGPWLPGEEFQWSGRFLCGVDSTSARKYRTTEEGTVEDGTEPVAGFRIFRVDPITVHDPASALQGPGVGQGSSRSLITFRRADSPALHRRVAAFDELGKPATWQNLGIVHAPRLLNRLVQSLSRDQRHTRETVGVLGLVHVGKPSNSA